jgi:hypothetical protein
VTDTLAIDDLISNRWRRRQTMVVFALTLAVIDLQEGDLRAACGVITGGSVARAA